MLLHLDTPNAQYMTVHLPRMLRVFQ